MKVLLIALVLAGISGTASAQNPELKRCLEKCKTKKHAAATICRSHCNEDSGTLIPEKADDKEDQPNKDEDEKEL